MEDSIDVVEEVVGRISHRTHGVGPESYSDEAPPARLVTGAHTAFQPGSVNIERIWLFQEH